MAIAEHDSWKVAFPAREKKPFELWEPDCNMKIGKTLYVSTRQAWRSWLAGHHTTEIEIWLVYYKKHTGKPRIPYNDAVEEALCYGWIDITVKKIDEDSFGQRFSPRKPTSPWSEMNKERARRLMKAGKMTRPVWPR